MVVAVVGAWLVVAAFVLVAWPKIKADENWRAAALALTLGFSLVHQLVYSTIAEDAYITFRYAQNIADGNGPVFNTGERIEGYANFLWMIALALPKAAFGADIETSAIVLGILATLGAVLLAYVTVNRVVARAAGEPRPACGVAAAMLVAAAGGLAAYGGSGTETPLFVLLILGVFASLAARRPVVAGVLVAFATMTRPSGTLLAVLVGCWLVVAALRGRYTWWSPVGWLLGGLVFVAPWTAWRATYYDHVLPTAVLIPFDIDIPARIDRGWHYLSGFSVVHQGFLLLGLVAAVMLPLRRNGRTPHEAEARALIWLMLVTAVVLAGFVVFFGGDAAPAWRLLAPIPPLLAVAAVSVYGVLAAASKPSPRPRPAGKRLMPAAAVTLSGLAVLASVFSPDMLAGVRAWHDHGAQMEEIGRWLGVYLPPGSVVSTSAPGALSYHAGTQLQIVGVRGQTEEADEAVVSRRHPTIAVITDSGYSATQSCVIDPEYAARYRVATFVREGTSSWLTVFLRADVERSVTPALDFSPEFRHVPCPS
ncbi:hypothetical protein [Amycolatopsis regifaucium]|uniref:Glycosyltransferase RgtA/B/C/D-like domain-containing protein n=1 Tax=Amycolatopsis regifaucium TaxID=546365 RepID=A0A154MAP4_9PSEU|nr:hypothetical protein [Amycolatopsis regifaucium]KZB81665.1 hypothetical protein AVL48_06640 [Amycolatopsis regifaucium]OKA06269.1 hypothetical protein ATP06_0224380 [Amycolatopsis regifaucium]SFG67053.1 hypothetical protein SAMN04489731_10193 [Amycolatopsis regifaucium]